MTNSPTSHDPTDTASWTTLQQLAVAQAGTTIRALNDADVARPAAMTHVAAGVHFDASRQRVTPEILTALQSLADERGVLARRDAMFAWRPHQRHRGPGRAAHRAPTTGRLPAHRRRRGRDRRRSTRCSTGWVSLLSRFARAHGLERRARRSPPSSISASVVRPPRPGHGVSGALATTATAASPSVSSPMSTRRT